MPSLPPLECLHFFEVAARRESFAKAAQELHVSPSAVAHRIKVLRASRRPPERARQGVSEGWPAHSGRDPGRPERHHGDSRTQRLKLVSDSIVACGVKHSGNRLRRKLTEMLSQASLYLHSASDPTRTT